MLRALCEVLGGLPADTVGSAHMSYCYDNMFNSKFIVATSIL